MARAAGHVAPVALELLLLLLLVLALASTNLVVAAKQPRLLGSPPPPSATASSEVLSIHAGAPENGGVEVRWLPQFQPSMLLLSAVQPSIQNHPRDSLTALEG